MRATSPATIPVTVVGGFLGAGKTTFLNHLLRTSSSRYAVLVNDFGAVNIDAGLIAKHDGATLTLTNGCVCCSTGGGFIDTLDTLLDSRIPFDHIVIEASGVGDPWRIAEIALVEPSLRLNAVIVIADASRIEHLLIDPRVGDTVRKQFERCDVVLLNKTDIVGETARNAARAAIAELRDGLRMIETSRHAMPVLPLVTRKAVSGFRADAAMNSADHELVFRRWCYQRSGSFDRERLAEALQNLPAQLIRLKGWCGCVGEADTYLLQMVERSWSLTPAETAEPSHRPGVNLVGVGAADLPAFADLDHILDCALVSPAVAGECTPEPQQWRSQSPGMQFNPL
jgi:G3E family GTPase